jgi:hypothetical protein
MADRDGVDLPDDLDQLLRQELSIEPSPAFAARVRERVGEGGQRRSWWRARWIPAIGSFATVASIAWALVVPAVTRGTSPPVPPAPPELRLAVVDTPRVEPTMPVTAAAGISRVTPDRRAAARAQEPDLPVVIVDGRQRAALSTLFTMMDQGWVSGDSFAATVPVSMEPIADQVGAITVAPVVVNAIPPGGVLPNKER